MPIPISEIAALLDGDLSGDGAAEIVSVASPENAGPDQIAFVADRRAAEVFAGTDAGCLIVPRGIGFDAPCPTISVDLPKASFARIGKLLHPRKGRLPEIHPSAVISDSASLGDHVFVGANCVVGTGSSVGSRTHLRSGAKLGDDVEVGDDCTIHQNVVIEDGCRIGNRVVIQAGSIIGSAGFGFVRDGSELIRFPQVGKVIIGDDVEIGANTCIDRGALGDTIIGDSTKIDNLVQVAHNVEIGKRVVIAALTGISGSVSIGDDSVVGGQVGFADHTTIEAGAIIGAKSAVFPGKRVKKGLWAGIPVIPLAEYKRLNAHIRSLPKLRSEVARLSAVIEKLEELFKK